MILIVVSDNLSKVQYTAVSSKILYSGTMHHLAAYTIFTITVVLQPVFHSFLAAKVTTVRLDISETMHICTC